MSIKKDLDDALAEKKSKSTKDKKKFKERLEEEHQALEEYLKEGDIIFKLEEIVSWIKEKGFPFSRVSSKNSINFIDYSKINHENLNFLRILKLFSCIFHAFH